VGGELLEDRGGIRPRWSGDRDKGEDCWRNERFDGECFHDE
jgi:hypothetical protein